MSIARQRNGKDGWEKKRGGKGKLVRKILPKGVSFDSLTQEQAYLALSHVNAYIRYVNRNRTPYEVFEFLYDKGMAAKLHIENIDPREVILKPRLVGIEMK